MPLPCPDCDSHPAIAIKFSSPSPHLALNRGMTKLHHNVQGRSNSLPQAAPLQASCMAMAGLSLSFRLLQTKEKIVVKVDDDLVRIGVDRTEQEEKARLHTAVHHEHECLAKHLGDERARPSGLGMQLATSARLANSLEMPCHHLTTAARRRQAAAHTCS